MLAFYISLLDTEEQRDKFEYIYRRHHRFMYYVAYNIVHDSFVSEDIVHETFLRLIRIIDRVRTENEKELLAFLKVLTQHQAIDVLRKRGRYQSTDDISLEDPHSTCSHNPETIAVDKIIFEEVFERIKSMDERYKTPLLLKVQGYKIDEIADFIEISPQNVKVRLHRARKMLLFELSYYKEGDVDGGQ